MPHLARLLGERGDQFRMRMPQSVDGNAAGEIKIALAAGRDEPRPLAAFEHEVGTRVGRHDGRGRRGGRCRLASTSVDTGLEALAEEADMGPISLSKQKKPRSERGDDARNHGWSSSQPRRSAGASTSLAVAPIDHSACLWGGGPMCQCRPRVIRKKKAGSAPRGAPGLSPASLPMPSLAKVSELRP